MPNQHVPRVSGGAVALASDLAPPPVPTAYVLPECRSPVGNWRRRGRCSGRRVARQGWVSGVASSGDSNFDGLASVAVLRPGGTGGSVDASSSRSARPWCPCALSLRACKGSRAIIALLAGGEADQRPWMGAMVPSGTASRLGRQGGACAAGVPGHRGAMDGASHALRASVASHHWRRVAIASESVRRGPRLSRLHRDSWGKRIDSVKLPPPVRAAEFAGPRPSAKRWVGCERAFGGHPVSSGERSEVERSETCKTLRCAGFSARLFCSPRRGVAAEGSGAHGKHRAQRGLPVAAHAEASKARRPGCRWQADQSQAQRGVQSPGGSGRRGSIMRR